MANTLTPVKSMFEDDNSINNTVTAAERMDHYIDKCDSRPTYKHLEAVSKQQSEPFPRLKMLEYQNEEIQAQHLANNNNNNNNVVVNGGSPKPPR